MIEDGLPLWRFFFFFSCQRFLWESTCPSQPCLWGLGGRNQGRRNNESSHPLQGIQRLLLCGGSSSLPPPTLLLQRSKGTTLTTGTRPPVTADSQSKKAREGCDHTSAALLGPRHSGTESCRTSNRQAERGFWAKITLSLSISLSSRTW